MYYILFLNLGAPEIVMLFIVMVVPFALSVIALIDIFKSSFQDPTNKVIWAVIVLLAPVFGALAYLLWGRKHKVTGNGSI